MDKKQFEKYTRFMSIEDYRFVKFQFKMFKDIESVLEIQAEMLRGLWNNMQHYYKQTDILKNIYEEVKELNRIVRENSEGFK